MPKCNKEIGSLIRQKTFTLSPTDIPARTKSFTGQTSLKYVYKSEGYDEENTYRFIGTSEAKDRDGEIVVLDGWEFTNYKANPIVLWGHDGRALPIGKTVAILTDEVRKAVYFDVEFSKSYDFAKTVEGLVEEGILRAVSLGFMVKDWKWDDKLDALLLTKCELFELSIVTVPANQEALIQEGKDATPDRNKSQDELANVVSQLKEEVESLRNQLAALKPNSEPAAQPEENGDPMVPEGEILKTENDDAKPEVTSESIISTDPQPISLELQTEPTVNLAEPVIAAMIEAIVERLSADKKEPEPEANEPEPEPEEPKADEPEAAATPELVLVNIEDLSEADSFVIVTEEEN